jgi:hypothetical protein
MASRCYKKKGYKYYKGHKVGTENLSADRQAQRKTALLRVLCILSVPCATKTGRYYINYHSKKIKTAF